MNKILLICYSLVILSARIIKDEWLSASLSAAEMIKIYEDFSVIDAKTGEYNSRDSKTQGNVLAFVTPWNRKGDIYNY